MNILVLGGGNKTWENIIQLNIQLFFSQLWQQPQRVQPCAVGKAKANRTEFQPYRRLLETWPVMITISRGTIHLQNAPLSEHQETKASSILILSFK